LLLDTFLHSELLNIRDTLEPLELITTIGTLKSFELLHRCDTLMIFELLVKPDTLLFELFTKLDTLINRDSPRKGYLTLLCFEILISNG
jgi:hypothetical protein